jgi:uncharacterized peroxidase-related enzyme
MFVTEPPLTEDVSRLYDESRQSEGFVMNLARAWAWRPDVFGGFARLRSQLMAQSSLETRDFAVMVCATAAELGDSYCSLAWGRKLAHEADAESAAAIIAGGSASALTARDEALARWARKVVRDPNATERGDVDALRAAGLSEREIVEATMFVALRLAFSSVNDALGVAPDAELAALAPPQVRDAVRFGRRPG